MQYSKILMLFTCSFLAMVSCNNDDDTQVQEQFPVEVTTLNFTLFPAGGGDVVVMTYQDLDGEDGNDPIITGGTLKPFKTYVTEIELLNEAVNPVVDAKPEIEAEGTMYQMFYESNDLDLDVNYIDLDANSFPLGLRVTVTTADVGTGTLNVKLVHQPSKNSDGVFEGSSFNALGKTAIEAAFPVIIE